MLLASGSSDSTARIWDVTVSVLTIHGTGRALMACVVTHQGASGVAALRQHGWRTGRDVVALEPRRTAAGFRVVRWCGKDLEQDG